MYIYNQLLEKEKVILSRGLISELLLIDSINSDWYLFLLERHVDEIIANRKKPPVIKKK